MSSLSTEDNSVKANVHGSYKISRIIPLTGQSVTLTTATTTMQVDFPDRLYNYTPSTFDYTLSTGAPSGTTYTRLHTIGLSMIERVNFSSAGNVSLIDQQNTDVFTRCVWGLKTRLQDYLLYDFTLGSDTALGADSTDSGFNLFKSNDRVRIYVQGTAPDTPDSALGEESKAIPSTDLLYNSVRIAGDGSAAAGSVAYSEFNYFKQSAADVTVVCNMKVPLSKLCPHSVFEDPDNVIYGQQMSLRVFFKPLSSLGWIGTSLINIQTGSADIAAATLTNMRISLAIETDLAANLFMRQKLMSQGFKYIAPFVRSELLVNASSSSVNHLVKINRGTGIRLLNIYSCVANAKSTKEYATEISNTGLATAKKVLSMQESINGSNLTEFVLDCTKGDDWFEMKDLLKDSCMISRNVWEHNRCFVRSFRKGSCVEWGGREDSVIDGKDLSGEEINYAIQYTNNATPATYRNFMFIVVQREVSILPGGLITVM